MAESIRALFDIGGSEEIGAYLDSQVCSVMLNKEKTAVHVTADFGFLVSQTVMEHMEDLILKKYNFGRVKISPRYQMEEGLTDEYINQLRKGLIYDFPSMSAALKSGKWDYSQGILTIGLMPLAAEYLSLPLKTLSQKIQNETGLSVRVSIAQEALHHSEEEHESLRQNDLMTASKEQESTTPTHSDRPKTAPKQEGGDSGYTYRRQATKPLVMKQNESIIFGKPVEDKPVSIDALHLEVGRVTVKGDIFYLETREIKAKNLLVINFDMTDRKGSIRVSKVIDMAKAEPLVTGLKNGMHVIVQGNMSYNNFEKEMVINPTSIIRSEKAKKMDQAEEKRVELHLHTIMSSMDSVANMADYVKLAKDWGHTAIALTDHGVVQSFPDAMNAAKKHDMKIIYGVEAYCINDESLVSVVKGPLDMSLDGEFIVFDLETTGLKATEEAITEIAAKVMRNGEIVEGYQSYVNPQRPISAFITELTGITDEMVADAPTIDKVLPEFLDFVRGRVLVAHNAGFDMSFINMACERLGIPADFTYVDTLGLARVLLPNLGKHKLNVLAKELKVGAFQHHRASEDARILSLVFARFLTMLQEAHKTSRLSEVNGVLSLLRQGGAGQKSQKSFHQIILVKNKQGLRNLYYLISEAHLNYFYRRPIIPKSLLNRYREGLILGSACEAGELFTAILDGKSQGELEKIAAYNDYLEIQPTGNNAFLIANGTARDEAELQDYNRKIVALGEKLDIPVVATGDVHFLEPEDKVFRSILMASKGFSDADNQAPLYFKSTDEMLGDFAYLGKEKAYEVVVKNTNLVANWCETIRPIPKETFTPKMENSAQELEDMSRARATEIYGQQLPPIVEARLEKELKSIIGNGFDVMYMIAQKLVLGSRERGYLVGSRGSVGSSLIAFLSGITEVNSLPPHYLCPSCKYTEFHGGEGLGCGVDMADKRCPTCDGLLGKEGFDIPFETFLGFDGDKAPDIDLNFSGEDQADAHQQTIDIFGEDYVFRAGTIGTVAEKTAYGYVKKYLQERGRVCSRAEENRLATGCTGVKRTTGQHPGGLMVVPKENSIYEFTPVQYPADDVTASQRTTHFDYHSIHDNLLKLDLLGHDDPTIIKNLEDLTGIKAAQIPLNDPETMSLFTSIAALKIPPDDILGTTGAAAIPEFGTKFVRGMLLDTMPKSFDELVCISGLSHGTDVWLGNAQTLIQNKTATLKEVICTRDDIMNFLITKGVEPKLSFTIMEAVRKGKGLKPEWEEAMAAQSVPKWYIDSCKMIKYMFPKAHAVAYVMMAFRIAWFKVHHPLAFYSAYFTIRAKAFDAPCMVRGAALVRAKIQELESKEKLTGVKPTAVEKDMLTTLEVCHEFYARGYVFEKMDVYTSDVSRFLVTERGLIPPLTSLPGIGETAATTIIEQRDKGKFLSVEELIMRCDKVSKSVCELLDSVGALGDIPKTAQVTFF